MTDYTADITDRYYGPPQSVLQAAYDEHGDATCTSAEHPVLRCNVFYPNVGVVGAMPEGGWPVVLFTTLSGFTHGHRSATVGDDQVIQQACLDRGMALVWADLPVVRGVAGTPALGPETFDPSDGKWGNRYRGNGVIFESTSNDGGEATPWPGPILSAYASSYPDRPHPWLDPLWLNSSKAAMWLVQHFRYHGLSGSGPAGEKVNIDTGRIGAFGKSAGGTSFAWPAYQPNRAGLTGDTSTQGQMDTRLNAAAFRQSTAYWLMFATSGVGAVPGYVFPQKPSVSLNNDYDIPATTLSEVDANTLKYSGADWFGGFGGSGFGGDLGDSGVYGENAGLKTWWSSGTAMESSLLGTSSRYVIDPPATEVAAHSIYKAYRVKARFPANTTMVVENAAAVDPTPETGGGVAADKQILTGEDYVYLDAAAFLQASLELAPEEVVVVTEDPQTITVTESDKVLVIDGGVPSTAIFAGVSASGLVPDPTSGSVDRVLRSDGTWGAQAGGGLSNLVEDTTPQLGGQLDVNGHSLGDGTRELLSFVEDASAVNNVELENEATGGGPILRATGTDTNIDLHLATKGTGSLVVDSNTTFGAHAVGFTLKTITWAASLTIDWNEGNKQSITMTGDVTSLTFTPPSSTCTLTLIVKQDGTGSHTMAWSGIKWPSGVAVGLSTAASSIDVFTFLYDGTDYLSVGALGFA
jgi:hypothetical protein